MTPMWNLTKRIASFMIIRTTFCRRVTGRRGGRSPCSFSKNEKKCPYFGKNPYCGHLWVKLPI